MPINGSQLRNNERTRGLKIENLKYDFLIASGGNASRLAVDAPKSLITIANQTILERLLSEVKKSAPLAKILVSSDRKELHANYIDVCSKFEGVDLYFDPGFSSTIGLVFHHLPILSTRFMFIYGHTIPKESLLNSLWESSNFVVSAGYEKSSRKMPFVEKDLFLEPPFLLNKSSFLLSTYSSWSEYFSRYGNDIHVLKANALSEFNYENELIDFKRSVAKDL